MCRGSLSLENPELIGAIDDTLNLMFGLATAHQIRHHHPCRIERHLRGRERTGKAAHEHFLERERSDQNTTDGEV